MGMYADITRIFLDRSPGLLARIGEKDQALFLSLTTLLKNRSLFGSPEQDVAERDLWVRFRVHYDFLQPHDLRSMVASVERLCTSKALDKCSILSIAEPIARAPSNDFLERVYLACKQSARDARLAVIDLLKQMPLSLQVDLICAFSTWVNSGIGLVMIYWLLDQCLDESHRLAESKMRVDLNQEEKARSLTIILRVMLSIYNGFSIFLYHSGYVKARHVERCLLCIPTLLDVLVIARPRLMRQLSGNDAHHGFNPEIFSRHLLLALRANDAKVISRDVYGEESLSSQYCAVSEQCHGLSKEAEQRLLSSKDFREKYRRLPRKIVQLLVYLTRTSMTTQGSVNMLMKPSMQPVINGLFALLMCQSMYQPESGKPVGTRLPCPILACG